MLQQYLRQPSETESALLFGFSLFRLIFVACVILALGILFVLLVGSFRGSWFKSRAGRFFLNALENKVTFQVFLVWASLNYLVLSLSNRYLDPYTAYRDRLVPFLWWSVFIAFQAMLSLLYVRSIGLNFSRRYRDVLMPAVGALILLGLFIGFVVITGLGLKPDPIYWQNAGTPIMLIQVLFAWVCGWLFYTFIRYLGILQSARLDFFICVSLWLISFLLWMDQPARPSYNSLAPTPPNFQSYPFGDSIIYDIAAHEYLIGSPIPSEFGVKPLYSLFLAFLHLLSGENYSLLVSLQVAVLAMMPFLVYLLTSQLGGRPAGIVAAILVILRERNGIALANVIEVSHVKLLMSDIFAMGFMVLSLWLFFRWFEKPEVRRPTIITLGGVISLLSLMRGHPIVLIPLMLCIILLILKFPLRLRLYCALLFTVGAAVPMIPWFWRNYEMTGEFTFQEPISRYTSHMAGLYSLSLEPPPRFDDETDEEYFKRLRGQPLEFILQHPGEVVKFVSAHQFHNMILSYVYLPHSFQTESLRNYVKIEPFWSGWKGDLQLQAWVLVFLNTSLIALGMGSSWRKRKALVLVPIIVGVGYTLSVSIGRLSGWRFIQPADWITLVYYSVGLMQISSFIGFILSPNSEDVEKEVPHEPQVNEKGRMRTSGFVTTTLVFFSIALALTYGNELFSSRYPAKPENQLLEEYRQLTGSMPGAPLDSEVASFLQADDAVILYGEALYPAYFKANGGAYNHYLLSYEARPYNRVVFHLLGPTSAGVILPLISPPFRFPDGVGVIVGGCKKETGVVDAVFILITDDHPVLYISQPFTGLSCTFHTAE